MKIEFKIDGMSCSHCIIAVEKNLSKLDLKKAEVNIGSAEIEFERTKIHEDDIVDAINEAGYKVIGLEK